MFVDRRGGTNVPSNSQGELLIGEFVPTSVIGFDGFGGDNDAGVTTLNVLRFVRNRPRDIAGAQHYRAHSENNHNLLHKCSNEK